MNLTFRKLTGLICFMLCAYNLQAQQGFRFRQQQDVKVVIGSDTLKQAWVGGLNAPVFSKIDLNQDGTEDLYIFDRMNSKSFTFLAENATGTWRWKYAPAYEVFFPTGMVNWVLLRDADGDGRKDLFTGNDNNVLLYKNMTSAAGPLTFRTQPHKLKFDAGLTLKSGGYILPDFTDVDNDGDLDMLVFDSNGKQVEYYKNLTAGNPANRPDSMVLTRETNVWGDFSRCLPACSTFAFGTGSCRVGKIMHLGGGSLTALDLDGDGDKDILAGSDLCPNLVRFTNNGTSAVAAITASSPQTVYPNAANPASFVNFPAAYYEDVNFDGKRDLLVAPFLYNNHDLADLNHSAWYYRNDAANAAAPPVFNYVKNNFLQDEMLDFGEAASPVFADIDGDGDQDLLVGNYADYRTGANRFRSAVSLFTNVGNATKPVFKLTNSDYLNLSQLDYRSIKLQFGDMNGDGSPDLIMSYVWPNGTFRLMDYIPNSAAPRQPYQFNPAAKTPISVTINSEDTPLFYDMDGDGDLDLLIGTRQQLVNSSSGALAWYRRTGAAADQFSSWALASDNLGGLPRSQANRQLQPLIADLNADGNMDLLITNFSGEVTVYSNFQNSGSTFSGQNHILFNSLLNNLVPTNLKHTLHAAAADLNGDQKPEIIIGTNGGGLVYLENESTITGLTEEKLPLAFTVYPNPASKIITVSSAAKTELVIYDQAGKMLYASPAGKQQNHRVDVSGFLPGIYFIKAIAENRSSAGKTIVVQH
ncbi:T9SS type A sorting domain-containing protein [Adhaeribacter soli]|uniref:T9SS type A sorting domain-containing protein n=1 Tax=Adhaeribacter soli TaxID=2607655 RepID=A0A5N1IH46_9BACT|nr:T9SS type A sorting domain-containing protein [Adhaeribacter soli]KAA9324983.1 T9SS type A sorting domain-containing protein [Adhaeribacter soli]